MRKTTLDQPATITDLVVVDSNQKPLGRGNGIQSTTTSFLGDKIMKNYPSFEAYALSIVMSFYVTLMLLSAGV